MGLLAGRANRRIFWFVSLLLFSVKVIVGLSSGERMLAELVVLLPALWLWWRRLHDLNTTGWWAFAPFVAGFIEGFIGAFVRGVQGRADTAPSDVALTTMPANTIEGILLYPGDFLLGFVGGASNAIITEFNAAPFTYTLSVLMTLALALLPGTRGANRFGPSPSERA